ncbi:uncharacterized protein PGTG_15654 [Puccinia graminis f. sp. tritici CRL 75-36-700-3]|uniref:Tet-like 2OG-Fe(II) oxygenase domain-containing protein n=1 Tax=Puccinia graminis f. sp. tritici (strain CRL 75-36-700-3 / race SCCL) TaxID=418459 RepID=E3KZG6_PUCGT|nr:uncharacterized protein PGTG_15654 [Puccinia graminis f. sp. tritici CRL 75-36-700-3]EFP89691.1 hypothetical protein PGTG_15654 [Puccinia graminis f. sp. tritici CRL 75-36-700-3]
MTNIRKAYLAERKRKNRCRRHADKRTSELSLTVDDTDRTTRVEASAPSSKPQAIGDHPKENFTPSDKSRHHKDSIIWCSKRYIPLELYPHILGDEPERPPTPFEIEYCNTKAAQFKYFHQGKIVIHDKDNESKIIAIAEFTRWDDITPGEVEEIGQLTSFLNTAKCFVNAVDSEGRSWGGNMFAIGWRKAMVAFELFGRYRNNAAIAKAPDVYDNLMQQSQKISSMLGRIFKRLANVAFDSNQELMKEYGIPSIGHLSFGRPINDDDCAPNLTFTSNRFFNSPHCDKDDLSEFAFGMFIPVNRTNWSIGGLMSPSRLSGGQFVFPNYRVGIDFSKHDGFVKLVWRSKEVRHCTLYSTNDEMHDQLGISLQINKKTASASRDTHSGAIFNRRAFRDKPRDKCYIGDHETYVKGER